MKNKGLVTLTIAIFLIAAIAYTVFVNSTIIKVNNYKDSINTAISMNTLYMLENGFYNPMQNYTTEHFLNGPLTKNNKGFMGYITVKKYSDKCNELINITKCPPSLYTINTQVTPNYPGIMQLSTSVYINSNDAKTEFSYLLSSLKASENGTGTLSVDDNRAVESDVGKYVSQYAVYNKPLAYNGTIMYTHILILRRDNIILTSKIFNENQSTPPGISQTTQSPEKMQYLMNNYHLS